MVQVFGLPVELILQFLQELDLVSLLRCRQLSRFFSHAVDNDAALQYKIELAISGMEDGPPSAIGPAARLQLLKQHRFSWDQMIYTSVHNISMTGYGVWELYGGVLAQGIHENGLIFTQLPSALRHVELKSWSLQDLRVKVRDFGMDPAQDLLVLIVNPPRGSTQFTVHLRSMKDGRPHPSTRNLAILSHITNIRDVNFTIQVCGQFLGIMLQNEGQLYYELVIWNWKTGAMEMLADFNTRCSFVFLSSRHVLVAYKEESDDNRELVMVIFDFTSVRSQKTDIVDMEFVCKFKFPPMDDDTTVEAVLLRSDPSPGWKPHCDLAVPFYRDRRERLFVLTAWFLEDGLVKSLSFFIPSSTVLCHVERHESGTLQGTRLIPWDDWGPLGTRLCPTPGDHSSPWVCFVFGMTFVGISPADGRNAPIIQIFDFNQVAVRKRLSEMGDEDNGSLTSVVAHTSGIRDAFQGVVVTSLPFLRRTFRPPLSAIGQRAPTMMLSEDALIIVNNVSAMFANEDDRRDWTVAGIARSTLSCLLFLKDCRCSHC